MTHKSFLLFLFFTTLSLGQETTKEKKGSVSKSVSSIVGSYFLYDDFQLGTILLNGEVAYENVLLNYNAYYDLFYLKESVDVKNEDANVVTKSEEYQIRIGKDTFILGPRPKDTKALQYFKIVAAGRKANLVAHISKVYKRGFRAPSGMTKDVPGMFIYKEKFYIVDAERQYIPVPKSKGKFLELFKDQKEKMKDAINKGNLKLDEEKDLSRLIRYYNVL